MTRAWLTIAMIGLAGAVIAQIAGAPLEPKPGANTNAPSSDNGSSGGENSNAPSNSADRGK